MSPRGQPAFVDKAQELLGERKFADAVKVCRLGLLGKPSCVPGRIALGQALIALARYDEVLAEMRAALEIEPESAPATLLMGEALFFKGSYSQAGVVLHRAADLDPGNETAKRLLGELGQVYDAGMESAEDTALELPEDDTRAYPVEMPGPAPDDRTQDHQLSPDLMAAGDPGDVDPALLAVGDKTEANPFVGSEVGEATTEQPVFPDPAPARPRAPSPKRRPPASKAGRGGARGGGSAPGGSASGRRWVDEKRVRSDDQLTRERVVVPSSLPRPGGPRGGGGPLPPPGGRRETVQIKRGSDRKRVGPRRAPGPAALPSSSRGAPAPAGRPPPPSKSAKSAKSPLRRKKPPGPGKARGPRAAPPTDIDRPVLASGQLSGGTAASDANHPALDDDDDFGKPTEPWHRPDPVVIDESYLSLPELKGINFDTPPPVAPGRPPPPGPGGRVEPGYPAPSSPPARATGAPGPGNPLAPAAPSPPSDPPIDLFPRASVAPAVDAAPPPAPAAAANPWGPDQMHAPPAGAVAPPVTDPVPLVGQISLNFSRRTWILIGGGAGLLLVILIIVVIGANRSHREETLRKLYRRSLAELELGTPDSLRRADRALRQVLADKPELAAARDARVAVAALQAIELGEAPGIAADLLAERGRRKSRLLAFSRVLITLARGAPDRAREQLTKGVEKHGRDLLMHYADSRVALGQGEPERALERIAAAGKALARRSLLQRERVRALLELERLAAAKRALAPMQKDEDEESEPIITVIAGRLWLRQPKAPVDAKTEARWRRLAASESKAGPRLRRWAALFLAEKARRAGKAEAKLVALATPKDAKREPALAEAVARYHFRAGAHGPAERLASTVRVHYPKRAGAIVLMARLELQRGNAAKAQAQLARIGADRALPSLLLVRGRTALALGNLEAAGRHLAAVTKLRPTWWHARRAYARLLRRQGKRAQALVELETLLRARPGDVVLIAEAARTERALGRGRAAVKRLDAALAKSPRKPQLLAELIRTHRALKDYANAQKTAAKAAPIKHPAAVLARAWVLLDHGRTARAAELFGAVGSAAEHRQEALWGEAVARLALGRWKAAAPVVERAAQANPRRADYLHGQLAVIRRQRRDRRRAPKRLLKALRDERLPLAERRAAAVALIEAYAYFGSRRNAGWAYREARRLLKDRGGPWFEVARAQSELEADRGGLALKILEPLGTAKVLATLPPVMRCSILARQAYALYLTEKDRQAGAKANEALAQGAECGRAHAVRGIVAYHAKRKKAAEKDLAKALAMDDSLAEAHYFYGLVLGDRGERQKAREHIRRYLDLRRRGPFSVDAKRALRRFR